MKALVRKIVIKVVLVLFGRGIASCCEANRLCSESRDRRLTAYERLSLRVHNRLCRECGRYAAQIDTVCACAKQERELPPLPECAKKRLADALRRADAESGGGSAGDAASGRGGPAR